MPFHEKGILDQLLLDQLLFIIFTKNNFFL